MSLQKTTEWRRPPHALIDGALATLLLSLFAIAALSFSETWSHAAPNLRQAPASLRLMLRQFDPAMLLFHLRTVGGTVLVAIIVTAFGRSLLQRILPDDWQQDAWLLTPLGFLLGGGLAGYLLFIIGTLWRFDRVVIATLLVLMIVAGRGEIGRWLVKRRDQTNNASRRSPWAWALTGLLILFLLISFTAALGPLDKADEITSHIKYTQQWLEARRIHDIGDKMDSHYPPMAWMQYAMPMALTGVPSGRLWHYLAFLALLALTYGMGRRWLGTTGGLWAALLVGSSTLMHIEASCANVDLVWAAYILASLACLLLSETRKLHMLSAAFLAMALFTKYPTLNVGLLIGLLLIFRTWRGRYEIKETGLRLAVFALAAFVFILPVWIRNGLTLGNPFSPFLGTWFGSPRFPGIWTRFSVFLLSEFFDDLPGETPWPCSPTYFCTVGLLLAPGLPSVYCR